MRVRATLLALAAGAAVFSFATPAHATGTLTISGTAFQDDNRNGVQDSGEAPMANQTLWLTDSNGNVLSATTGSNGGYAFSGLGSGLYRIDYENSTYRALKDDWVPTTTGSLKPSVTLNLTANTAVSFGWRKIVRSTTLSQPIDVYTGPSGLRVESFDDVVPAKTLHDALAAAYLTGEAPLTTVRFDYGTTSVTTSGSGKNAQGVYSNYSAVSYVSYASWRDMGPVTLTHEYGHAWSEYHAYIDQQDPSLTSYLKARGLYGDARLGSSMAWDPAEMVAEDYRQLFGSSAAASATQMNPDIPRADQVPGLKDFLANTFTHPVSTSSTSSTPPAPLVVDQLSAASGKRGVTIGFRLSEQAAVTVRITDSRGALVQTVESSVATSSGSSSVLWDGTSSAGRRVKTTGLTATVQAQTSDGRTGSGTVTLP